MGLLSAIVVLPQLVGVARGGGARGQPSEIVELFSANAAGYLVPTWKQLFYSPLLDAVHVPYFSAVPGEATFLGYTLVALALIGIVKTRPRVWGLWVFIAAFFFVLSLGPSLHLFGRRYDITLPYALFNGYLPFFNIMRTPHRFVVFVTLACGMLASYGLSAITGGMAAGRKQAEQRESRRSNFRSTIFPILIALLLMLELWNIPFASKKVVVPDIYFEIAKEQGEFGVLDLPVNKYRQIATYMMYQTVHEKPIATGLISRGGEKRGRMLKILGSPRFSKPETLTKEDLNTLKKAGFRYIIHHSTEGDNDFIAGITELR